MEFDVLANAWRERRVFAPLRTGWCARCGAFDVVAPDAVQRAEFMFLWTLTRADTYGRKADSRC